MRDDTHIQYFLHFYNQIALKLQIASSLKDEKDFMSNKESMLQIQSFNSQHDVHALLMMLT